MIKLHESWRAPLQKEFDSPYMAALKEFLRQEREAEKLIYPKASDWFRALNATPLDKVKAVVLGQDPYHGDGQAHGLCFSVERNTRIPPSLVNIYKELDLDLHISPAPHGNLLAWAEEGVLLLNSVLTVEAGRPASHRGKGWEQFTDAIIKIVNEQSTPKVFILWGSYAQKKANFIDAAKHKILKSVHPSPLSAHNGFFGSRPFSKTNEFLTANKISPINWQVDR